MLLDARIYPGGLASFFETLRLEDEKNIENKLKYFSRLEKASIMSIHCTKNPRRKAKTNQIF